jgi:hypothetical protein
LRDVFPSQGISGRKFQKIGPAGALFDAAHFFQQRSGPLQLRVLATYTFTSPFSFNSAAENGLFFFWFR